MGLAPRLVGLAVLLACLAGGSVAISVISSARTALRDEILETHLVMADLVAAQLSTYVMGVEADASDLAEHSSMVRALNTGNYTDLDANLARWRSQRKDRIDNIGVYSADGMMVATSNPNRALVGEPLLSNTNSDTLRYVLQNAKPALGLPLRSKTTGRPIVPYYSPVRTASGELVGVFSVTLSLQALSDTLMSLQLAPGSKAAVMDNTTGLVLVTDDPTKLLSATSTGRNAASQNARAGMRGAMENVRSDGEQSLAAYSPVSSLSWSVLLQQPSQSAFEPIDAMTRQALVWVVAAMLAAGLIAAGLSMSIVRPLKKLRATAERMASGDLGRRTGVRRGDEIGDLGNTFDRMAAQLEDSVQELTRQALSDNLTSLPNRVLLRQRLEYAIASGEKLALLLLDLDHFKEVNDTLGHSCGDALLQQLGLRLKDALRKSDTIARLGGDEFAIVLGGVDAPDAVAIADSLRTLIGKPFELNGRVVTVDASIGVACHPVHGSDVDTLMRCADVAMYVSKRSGQGVSVYAADQDQHTPDRLALIGELRSAIELGELALAFQPLIDCELGEVAAVEALVRWPHARHGMLSPDQFIPLAEQTGLIRPLSRWVLGAALRQQHAWRRLGLDVPVSVNLSMLDLHDLTLPQTVAALFEELGVARGALRVELTESSLMSDPVRALETLTRLREMGVNVSIDDFGTGYSSLAYLKQLPVDELKIDRSFVRDVAVDESDLAIVRSTIDLAHNLGLSVVAEGVEDSATLELLRALGCDKAQGDLISRPRAASDLTPWLLRRGDDTAAPSFAAD